MIKVTVKSDEKGLSELKNNLMKAITMEGRAGFYSDQIHPESKTPLSDIAYYNTFGSEGNRIPERPFMQDAARDGSFELGSKLAKHWGKVLAGVSPKIILFKSSETMAKWISNVITVNEYTPNAKNTIRKKGFDNPLTHTGYLPTAVRTSVERIDGEID